MDSTRDLEETVANKIEEIHKLELEALRRAGVAKEKEQGLEIESTEAIRLFREATGYLLRLRELRDDLKGELQYSDQYHSERVIGYVHDYNRILRSLRENRSFENCVSGFTLIEYDEFGETYDVEIEGRKVRMRAREERSLGGTRRNVSMVDSNVGGAILPRIRRLTIDIESSVVGRCASGKRP